MTKQRRIIHTLVLATAVLAIYAVLTSTIVDIRTERAVHAILVDSFYRWKERTYGYQEFVANEAALSAKIDPDLAKRLSGRIILQIEAHGEAWYLNPSDGLRYYLGRPSDVYRTIKRLGIKVDKEKLTQYLYFDKKFPVELLGRFVVSSDASDPLYYVHPETAYGHPIMRPDEAVTVLREQGTGITNASIRTIAVGSLN